MSDKMCGSEKERKIYWVPPYTSSQQFDIKKYILSTELSNKLIKIIIWAVNMVYEMGLHSDSSILIIAIQER